jgi:hypothetical protein
MFKVEMPKSRDFLLALVPGFSERFHPGIFLLKFRDIPGFIFYSNTYLSSLVNSKCKHNAMFQNNCFRTSVSEQLFQNNCFRTTVSEQLFQINCFRATVSEQLFQINCFRSTVSDQLFQNNCFRSLILYLTQSLVLISV